MSSQETDHVSPTEVTPELGKGALGTWRPTQPYRNVSTILRQSCLVFRLEW